MTKGWRGHGKRLVISAATGIAAAVVASKLAPPETVASLGWDGFAIALAAQIWIGLLPASAKDMRAWSAEEDEGRWTITILLSAVVAASMVSIFTMVSHKSSGVILALAAFTIFCSWFMLHTVYATHYAHRCYSGGADKPGLDFPGEPPAFTDFAYYSFTIGMTFQTSDVDTKTTDMRTLTLVHGVVSFVFNTVIIAISVGLASGLLGGN